MNLLRSPLWSVLFIIATMLLMSLKLELEELPKWFYITVSIGLIVGVGAYFIWFTSVLIQNRKHPTQKVHWLGFYPVEFREEDEGMRWLTYRACKRVYVFFYISLPMVLLALFLFPNIQSLPILLVGGLALAQYIIYWSVIRRANTKEEEA